MKKNKFTKYLIIAALMLAQTAPVTFADSDKSGFKFPTTITAAPIGSAETIGSLEINGRYVGQQGMLWNGDVVSAATGNTAAVSLSSIGSITLRGGSAVKLATDTKTSALIATIISGEMKVNLLPASAAKVDIAGASFILTKGAKFRAGWRDDKPVVEASEGQVLPLGNWLTKVPENIVTAAASATQQAAPRRYLIKPYNLGASTDVRARSTRSIQVRVTDENDKPVPDVPVLFLLSGGTKGANSGGSLGGQSTLTVKTNAQGVAQTTFTASNVVGGIASVKAMIEGTDAVWEGSFKVINSSGGFWSPQTAVPVFAIVGAALGIGIYKLNHRNPLPTTPDITRNPQGGVILP